MGWDSHFAQQNVLMFLQLTQIPGIFLNRKNTKHIITIIIPKKPTLINYNNAPLTKTKLLKKTVKTGHIEKKTEEEEIWSKHIRDIYGISLKRIVFFIYIILICFHVTYGASVALGVIFPLHLWTMGRGKTFSLELVEDFFWGAQLDRNFRSAIVRGFSATAAASNLWRNMRRVRVHLQGIYSHNMRTCEWLTWQSFYWLIRGMQGVVLKGHPRTIRVPVTVNQDLVTVFCLDEGPSLGVDIDVNQFI